MNKTAYSFWLRELGQIHLDTQAWNGTVRFVDADWRSYFKLGFSPRLALKHESGRQIERAVEQHLKRAAAIQQIPAWVD